MKILTLHTDYIRFEAQKKAISSAEDVEKGLHEVKECLVVLTAVEKRDEEDPVYITKRYVQEIAKVADQVKTKTIVLYPYAHLSSELGNPKIAVEIMKDAELELKGKQYQVSRAPFGWYKSFELKCKGHPLAELSRSFGVEKEQKPQKEKKESAESIFLFQEHELNKEEKTNLTAAYIVAKALQETNNAKIGQIGLHQDFGFVDVSKLKLSNEDFTKIEKKAHEIIKHDFKIKESKEELQDSHQIQIMKDLADKGIVYAMDNLLLVPTYKEPFYESTKMVKSIKILELSGAYWKNNAENEQLTRLLLIGFATKEDEEHYEKKQKDAELRNHRKIVKDMDLVFFHDFAPGSPFFLEKGTRIFYALQDFVRGEYKKRGYQEVITPQMYNKKLWEISGHWEHYKDNMFVINVEGQEHSLKPMNCPSHCLIYNKEARSYKDLPIRIADFCFLHRNELSGTLTGLMRVRRFAQDDAHIFCRMDQIEDEVLGVLDFIQFVYTKVFNFKIHYYLSTRPEDAMGSKEIWDTAEELLEKALHKAKIKFEVKRGEGAFYGPKIDIDIEDSLGRKWQCPTCQLDFNLPQRFETVYNDENSKKQQAVMIHRAVLGSLERFIGIMIEHFSGKLPLWLAPIQVQIVTVTDRNIETAQRIKMLLEKEGVRVELDDRSESIGKKVREAQIQKINYIVTIGDKEMDSNTLAIRTREGKVEFGVQVNDFMHQLKNEINTRKIEESK
jgi:threonyl-tRNA synthetase